MLPTAKAAAKNNEIRFFLINALLLLRFDASIYCM